jgi:DNA (cytosine-5)-methyltransferase 1
MTLTVTDLFCGGGGSSTGAIQVPGVEIRMAANHWDLAVEVHNQNHPDADHAAVDLHEEDPRYFPHTDILWASPECTKWSQASGGRYASVDTETDLFNLLDPELIDEDPETAIVQRSRLLMFDVLRFADHHRYAAMVIENVVDIATNPKYADAWALWQRGLKNLGYRFRVVSLNSMHAQAKGDPAPQSRDRLYVVCWLEGNTPPDIDSVMRPLAWCPACESVVESQQAWKPGRTVGKYRSQYVYLHGTCGTHVEPGYLPAAAAIDWTLVGTRIGDRTKPLADKTRRRIAAGIARYWSPFHMEQGGNQYDAADPKHKAFGDPNGYYRAWSTHDVLRTLHTQETKALVVPLEGRAGDRRNSSGDPLRTQTSRHLDALVQPFIMDNNHVNRGRRVSEALPTLTTATTKALLEPPPFIAELRGGGSTARPASDPLSTVSGSWNDDARPTSEALRALTTRDAYGLLMPYYGTSQGVQETSKPIGTLTTVDRYALIQRHNSSKGDGAEMITPAEEYLRTLTTKGHQSLITPGDVKAAEAQVDDCLFRMLEPAEVAAGMAFPADYIWGGTRRERVKLCGNAVTPPAARDLIAAVAASLGGGQ